MRVKFLITFKKVALVLVQMFCVTVIKCKQCNVSTVNEYTVLTKSVSKVLQNNKCLRRLMSMG